MTIIWVITGVLELILLITVIGVLVSLAALFSLLELMIISINPVCLYLVRKSGILFTCLIGLTIRQVKQISLKMCSSPMNEQIQEPIVATIEPLPPEMESTLYETFVTNLDIPGDNNLVDLNANLEDMHNDDERSHNSDEIQSITVNQDEIQSITINQDE